MQECNGCGAVKETNLWKKSFEGALRERARELIEQILGEEVEAALGAGRGRRVAERLGVWTPSDGPGRKVVFYCRTKPGVVNLGWPLRVVTAAGERELLLIAKRRISLWSLAYQVSVPATQECLGVIVRTDLGGALWLLLGGDGRQIGWVERVAARPGFQRYQAHIGDVPVCHFVWREKLLRRDQVEIAFVEVSDRTLDKRLGLAPSGFSSKGTCGREITRKRPLLPRLDGR